MKTGGFFITSRIGERPVFSSESFSDEQKEFSKAGEDFGLKEILPQRDEIEKFDKELTLGLMRKCGEIGFLGVDVPEQFGGLGLDKVTSALLAEKITYGRSASFTVTFSAHTGIGTLPIVFFGNEEQKKKYLPKLASGEWLSAYALTEPGSGSDALSVRSTAVLSPDKRHYILNGNKQFISNGGWANLLITFAKVNGEKITGFLIDPESEGVIRNEEKNKMGLHGSSTCNVILENVKVPVENTLGEIGKGGDIAFNSLNIGRFKLGAAVLGGCKSSVTVSVQYALERKQFGQPVARFDAIRKKFADMAIRAYALDSIIYETAGLLDESIAAVDEKSPDYYQQVAYAIEKIAMECSICKVYGSEAISKNADEGLQVFGGYGFIEDYPMARIVRDTRVDRIYEGTNEINRQIILGYILKKTLMEELPIREKIKEIPTILSGGVRDFGNDVLAAEKRSLEAAKYLTLYILNEALIKYGQDLAHEQQVGEIVSDMVIDLFVINTTLARISQSVEKSEYPSVLLAMGQVLTAEKMISMAGAALTAVTGILDGENLKVALQEIGKLRDLMYLPTNTLALKKKIADLVYKEMKYPF